MSALMDASPFWSVLKSSSRRPHPKSGRRVMAVVVSVSPRGNGRSSPEENRRRNNLPILENRPPLSLMNPSVPSQVSFDSEFS